MPIVCFFVRMENVRMKDSGETLCDDVNGKERKINEQEIAD